MIEPIDKDINIALQWLSREDVKRSWGRAKGNFGHLLAAYEKNSTAELQGKIERLEIGMVELGKIAVELRAELAARDFVPITGVHKDVAGYNLQRIAYELDRTALGEAYYGNALRVAKDIPILTDEDRSVLDRYAVGINSSTDHVKLQDISYRLREIKETTPTHAAPLPEPPVKEGE